MIYTIYNVVPGTKVYVDGNKVDRVFCVDTKRGFVDHYLDPLEATDHGDDLAWERIKSDNIVIVPPGTSEHKTHLDVA